MASVASHIRTGLILTFETGLDEYGKPILKRVTLPRVRFDLTEDEISQFSMALGSLSKHSLYSVDRVAYHSIKLV